jgi:putative nucleotidyltransferase with HDIG domain
MEIIQAEELSSNEMIDIILQDQSLYAKVLRIANSAFYGSCGKVSTLSRAMVTIGLREVQNICLCALLTEHFINRHIDSKAQRQLWQHAFVTAKIARSMAQKRPWINDEEAYAIGLLHDIGRAALLYYFYDDYAKIRELARCLKVPGYLAEWQYGITHTEVGKWLAMKWHFPKLYQSVIEFHHTPWTSPAFQKEAMLIHLADILAHQQDYPELAAAEPSLECRRQLYIPEEEWQGYSEQLHKFWEEAASLWQMLRR